MILIADGGSTKADWVALDMKGRELFRTRSKGLNPAILEASQLKSRLENNFELTKNANAVKEVYFYGAGCGTPEPSQKLKKVLQDIFPNAKVNVAEDMLAAVYAASGGKGAIVCILGTGSNSCYFYGKEMHQSVPSLGFILMDEASGNYFGKKLIIDYYYKRMPEAIAKDFESQYDLSADTIKKHLYQMDAPNAYLGQFAEFMFKYTDEPYMHQLIREGFEEFFEKRVNPYGKKEVPVYFIGSIAYFFRPILEEVAQTYGYQIADVIRR
ncbi:MAG TPA: N-acetylglucosamine kinase, partial [Flavobacteriales bacterium]|nr:N-acetylglucosamine kinase [Flavobacteriales bacterium]